MKKSELQKLVKEAIEEVKQENLQQEGKLGKILGGAALLAALLMGNAKLNNKIYDQSPKLKVLVQKLEKAKADGNEELVDKIEDQLNKFEQFQASDFAQGLSNTLPVIDGENVASVNKPIITANPRGGIGIFGELFGGLADAAGDLGSAVIEGDAGTLNVLKNLGNLL